MIFSDIFKVMITQRQILENGTTYSYTYNGRPIESRTWSIERHHFQWPWTTPTRSFEVTPFFDAEYLRNVRHATYTRPIQHCHFQWSRV